MLVKHTSQARSSCRATSMQCIYVCREMDSLVERLSQHEPGSAPLRFATPYPQSTLQQYFILLRKNTVCYWRYPQYNTVRLNVVVIFGLLLGAVFWSVGRNRCISLSLHPFLWQLASHKQVLATICTVQSYCSCHGDQMSWECRTTGDLNVRIWKEVVPQGHSATEAGGTCLTRNYPVVSNVAPRH